MSCRLPQISVCVCTYKRPHSLKRLLGKLSRQETKGQFTYSIVVADNDCSGSARNVVEEFAATSSFPVIYCVEPQQNIALARNKAIAHAEGKFIAFIDDDEFPAEEWLWKLFETCHTFGAAGVLGPVKPFFLCHPPDWVLKGKLFDRPTYKTGHIIHWRQSRTGNALLRKEIFDGLDEVFRPQFGLGGEDVDFFERMAKRGHKFVWSNEADIYEVIPQNRCTRRYLLRRALLRGKNSMKREGNRVFSVGKSIVAIPVYALGLPLLFVLGHHHFMKYLIKCCDHAGKILEILGCNMIRVRETYY